MQGLSSCSHASLTPRQTVHFPTHEGLSGSYLPMLRKIHLDEQFPNLFDSLQEVNKITHHLLEIYLLNK